MAIKNYYDILLVSGNATTAEIKQAYRSLARKYHPDSGSPLESQRHFQRITEAYRVLSDEELRKKYDEKISSRNHGEEIYMGETEEDEFRQAFYQQPDGRSHVSNGSHSSASSMSDNGASNSFFSKIKEQLGKPSPSRSSSKKGQATKPEAERETRKSGIFSKGEAQEALKGPRIYNFTVDALESIRGTSREVALKENGEARIVRVKVPSGVEDGAILRVEVPRHDPLRIKVHVTPHRFVKREGDNIVIRIPTTIPEAIFGAEIVVPTLNGPVKINVPPKSEENSRLRLKGRGLKNLSTGHTGDLLIHTEVIVPDNLSAELKEQLRQVENCYNSPVRKDVPTNLL